jgi:hypothetical protein
VYSTSNTSFNIYNNFTAQTKDPEILTPEEKEILIIQNKAEEELKLKALQDEEKTNILIV